MFLRDADGLAETELLLNLHSVPSGATVGVREREPGQSMSSWE